MTFSDKICHKTGKSSNVFQTVLPILIACFAKTEREEVLLRLMILSSHLDRPEMNSVDKHFLRQNEIAKILCSMLKDKTFFVRIKSVL
jgi:hypothetical protein